MKQGLALFSIFFSIQFGFSQDQRRFANCKELFAFIADDQRDSLPVSPTDEILLFQLAADSMITYVYTGIQTASGAEGLWIVTANLYDYKTRGNLIRGVSQNGRFYVLEPVDQGFKLVGTMDGNMFRTVLVTRVVDNLAGGRQDVARITCHWRGATTCPVYVWDGKAFQTGRY